MKLYKILSPMQVPHVVQDGGKCDEVILAYILAESDDAVYDYIERRYYPGNKYQDSGWACCSNRTRGVRKKIMADKGDYTLTNPEPHTMFFWYGEFYTLGCRWIDLGEVSAQEILVLKRLNLLAKPLIK